jgi:hypothetical protein
VAVAFEAGHRIQLILGSFVDVDRSQMIGFPPVTAIVAPET